MIFHTIFQNMNFFTAFFTGFRVSFKGVDTFLTSTESLISTLAVDDKSRLRLSKLLGRGTSDSVLSLVSESTEMTFAAANAMQLMATKLHFIVMASLKEKSKLQFHNEKIFYDFTFYTTSDSVEPAEKNEKYCLRERKSDHRLFFFFLSANSLLSKCLVLKLSGFLWFLHILCKQWAFSYDEEHVEQSRAQKRPLYWLSFVELKLS